MENSLLQALPYGIDQAPLAGPLLPGLPDGTDRDTRQDGVHTVNSGHSIDVMDLVPSEFYLGQNYPNPFSEKTAIKFCVAYRTRVTLEIFTAEGKKVQTLVDGEKDAGTHEVECVARGVYAPDGNASDLPEGIYICRLQAGDFVEMKEMEVRGHHSPMLTPWQIGGLG